MLWSLYAVVKVALLVLSAELCAGGNAKGEKKVVSTG